ncbi:MAG: ABC transporter permease [Alphaproteobacteria bacterium]|nr:ABC transporter permease [Alphaproteobacteria bacterium]
MPVSALAALRRRPLFLICVGVVVAFALLALVVPFLPVDPAVLNPLRRLRAPSMLEPFGTDHVGRSVLARTLWGTQISLGVGLAVAALTTLAGVSIGLLAGYIRALDMVLMRVMDAVMAVPAILLAIALVALIGAGPVVIVVAISMPEIPRMARTVRAGVLVLRELAFVEAATICGGRLSTILLRHILPSVAGPVLVQATYVFAAAMILEAILSFLGAGTPPDVASWGNMMAEGRQYLEIAPWILVFPAIALTILVLAINVIGDELRDMLDPESAR